MSAGRAPPPPPIEHAHHAPPPHVRAFHKTLQKASVRSPPPDIAILDLSAYDAAASDPLHRVPEHHRQRLTLHGTIPREKANAVFSEFEQAVRGVSAVVDGDAGADDIPIFEHSSVPGLLIIPSLLPLQTQSTLLTTLLTRALPRSSEHANNLTPHYELPDPCPFFSLPTTSAFEPKDPAVHRPITVSKALQKKLRWFTLGGQYDWTLKRYPPTTPPSFPPDVATLVGNLFPSVIAQAAIINLYSPGDTLAPHRDIAEASGAGLVSISIGCAGWFVIGREDGELLAMQLNSGDAVVMGGESRWAWHSVPKILDSTCPPELVDWDGGSDGEWAKWCSDKRINVNVRQMWDQTPEDAE